MRPVLKDLGIGRLREQQQQATRLFATGKWGSVIPAQEVKADHLNPSARTTHTSSSRRSSCLASSSKGNCDNCSLIAWAIVFILPGRGSHPLGGCRGSRDQETQSPSLAVPQCCTPYIGIPKTTAACVELAAARDRVWSCSSGAVGWLRQVAWALCATWQLAAAYATGSISGQLELAVANKQAIPRSCRY